MIRDDVCPNDIHQAPPSSPEEAMQRVAAANDLTKLSGARFKDIDQLWTALKDCGYTGRSEVFMDCGRHKTYKAVVMDKAGLEYRMVLNQVGDYSLDVCNVMIKGVKLPMKPESPDDGAFSLLLQRQVLATYDNMEQLRDEWHELGFNFTDKILMQGTMVTRVLSVIDGNNWEYKAVVNESVFPTYVIVLNVQLVKANPDADPVMVAALRTTIKEG